MRSFAPRSRPARIARLVVASYLVLALAERAAAQVDQRVPDGLSAQAYLELGRRFKAAGWPEPAREALRRSISADPSGVGKEARLFLTGYIPRFPVPPAAAMMNIAGYNQMAGGDFATAALIYQECIAQFPTFEWPYGNLGYIYIQQGRIKDAREILERALAINPSYVNGWIHLTEANLRDGDLKAALRTGRAALRLDPQHVSFVLTLEVVTVILTGGVGLLFRLGWSIFR